MQKNRAWAQCICFCACAKRIRVFVSAVESKYIKKKLILNYTILDRFFLRNKIWSSKNLIWIQNTFGNFNSFLLISKDGPKIIIPIHFSRKLQHIKRNTITPQERASFQLQNTIPPCSCHCLGIFSWMRLEFFQNKCVKKISNLKVILISKTRN